jgi:putative restriction endonuclease
MEHLRPSLDEINVGPHRSALYDVLSEDGTRFPPKCVISVAFRLKYGTDLPFENFSGGEAPGQANFVLRDLEFTIVPKPRDQHSLEPVFGEIPGISPGTTFDNRKELSDAYVHRPIQAGIWGGAGGAYSIVLSGGYVDDEDFGDEIIYTGQGGRDLRTGRQIHHQTLTRGNLALAKSHSEGLPVRVIRGSQHGSDSAPQFGYRYDGLYRVADYWKAPGEDNFDVWRFKLLKLNSQVDAIDGELNRPLGNDEPERRETVTLRIVRDSNVSKAIKRIYEHKCQVCGLAIDTPGGLYAEAAHIRPLGRPHNGSDSIDNVLCLCPNHHVMFDNFGFTLTDDLQLVGIDRILNVREGHNISIENVRYHREHRYKNPRDY